MLSLIVAHDTKFGIGKNNNLPWRLTHEIQNFKKITTGSKINNKIKMLFTKLYSNNMLTEIKCNTPNTT